jgi:hypothetical protein
MVGLIFVLIAGGCASTERAVPVSDVAPADFTLEATVMRGPAAPPAEDVAQRPSRYVLFPDGSLHSEVAVGVRPTHLPARMRTLSREQVDGLWRDAVALDLADPDRGEPPTSMAMEATPAGITNLLVFSAGGRRWMFRAVDPGPDDASTRIVHELARLAWTSRYPDPEVMIIPRRYDLGPDPYARFRP